MNRRVFIVGLLGAGLAARFLPAAPTREVVVALASPVSEYAYYYVTGTDINGNRVVEAVKLGESSLLPFKEVTSIAGPGLPQWEGV